MHETLAPSLRAASRLLLASAFSTLIAHAAQVTAVPYVNRIPSWLVLDWSGSTAAGSVPSDAYWTLTVDDPKVSKDQIALIRLQAPEQGFDGTFPRSGSLTLHDRAQLIGGQLVAGETYARFSWPDGMPESIRFDVTLTTYSGNQHATSKTHAVRVWKALRSSSASLPSFSATANAGVFEYQASWLGGPGPVTTHWEVWEGITGVQPTPTFSFDFLHDPSVIAANPWLQGYGSYGWFNGLMVQNSLVFNELTNPALFYLVGDNQFSGGLGSFALPVSPDLLKPISDLTNSYYPGQQAAAACAWRCLPTGGIDASLDSAVSNYQAGLETGPFPTPAEIAANVIPL